MPKIATGIITKRSHSPGLDDGMARTRKIAAVPKLAAPISGKDGLTQSRDLPHKPRNRAITS